jgi:hypothetical protein
MRQTPTFSPAPSDGAKPSERPGTSGGGAGAGACRGEAGAQAPWGLRRLNRREYANTIQDLLGVTTPVTKDFAPEGGSTGFDSAADGAQLNEPVVDQYVQAAKVLARDAVGDLPKLLGCDPAKRGEGPCLRSFLEGFGRRAFRRPLLPDELQRYEALHARIEATDGFATAVELTLRALLTAPSFLYRVEHGVGAGPAGAAKTTPHELASRLSYFLWASMPDEELLRAADAGELATEAHVLAQMRRMLQHTRAVRLLRDMHGQWLDLERLESGSRGASFPPSLGAAMRREVEAYFGRLLQHPKAGWEQMMTSTFGQVNAELAAHLGLPAGGAGDREIARPADRHRGFLTLPGVLTATAASNDNTPIFRGKFLREQILCEPPIPPPADLDPRIPAANQTKTARQQLEDKTERVEPCRTCHTQLNPLGFAFDGFDNVGRARDVDAQGRPFDTRGVLEGTDVPGAFTGHLDLIDRLKNSRNARACYVVQWFRYASGRRESDGDACLRERWLGLLEGAGGGFEKLLLAMTTSELFLRR